MSRPPIRPDRGEGETESRGPRRPDRGTRRPVRGG